MRLTSKDCLAASQWQFIKPASAFYDVSVDFNFVFDMEANTLWLALENDADPTMVAQIINGVITPVDMDPVYALRDSIKDTQDGAYNAALRPVEMFLIIGNIGNPAVTNVNSFLTEAKCHDSRILLNLLLFGYEKAEKLGKTFIQSLETKDLMLEDAKKRHQMIGLPQKLIQVFGYFADSECASTCIKTLVDGNFDGNDLTEWSALIDAYWRNMMFLLKPFKQGYDNRMMRYIVTTATLAKRLNCSVMRVAEFLAKQALASVAFREAREPTYTNSYRNMVCAPDYIAMEYSDYLDMGGLPWPADLFKEKAIVNMHGKVEITDADREKFTAYGMSAGLKLNYEHEGYRFVTPTDYDEFLKIGIAFHNCLPVCGKLYMNGNLDIVFVYPPNADMPTAALEVNGWKMTQQVTFSDLPITDPAMLSELTLYGRWLTFQKKKEAV